ncbi:hypothetical protein PINS_up004750 [Pythium insidiosum]|nr:hypothetical protein PINS_up004750 [Pythium insidiosum]
MLEDIAALVSSARSMHPTAKEAVPKLKVSASGRFEDQFYHAQKASRTMGLLKNRAYFKRSESKTETVDARKKGANVNARDVEQFSDADIVFSGYLIKQGSFWKSWRKRYFILRRDVPVLAYYTSQDNLVKLGEIVVDAETHLDPCKTLEPESKENNAINAPTKQGTADNRPSLPDAKRPVIDPIANRFIVEHNGRKLVLRAETAAEKDQWMSHIERCIALREDAARRSSITDWGSFRDSTFMQMRQSGSGSLFDNSMVPPYPMTAPPAPIESPHHNVVKRQMTDSRVIKGEADQASANLTREGEERERYLRQVRLKSMDSPLDLSFDMLTTFSGTGSIPPRPRLFRSYSAGSVLSTRSVSKQATRAQDDSGLTTFVRAQNGSGLLDVEKETRARNLSLPGLRPAPSVELAVSIGCRGPQDVGHMLVTVSRVVPGQPTRELTRTEVQRAFNMTACGGGLFMREFSSLLSIPVNTRDVLQFDIFAVTNLGTEALAAQQSLGYVRISGLDLLFSRDTTTVQECRRPKNSPSKQAHFLVVDRIIPSDAINLGHSYLYAKRHFVADVVPKEKSKQLNTSKSSETGEDSVTATEPPNLPVMTRVRSVTDAPDGNHLFISEELSASYCSLSVVLAYLKMVQARNKQFADYTDVLATDLKAKCAAASAGAATTAERIDILNSQQEMIADALSKHAHYVRLLTEYKKCESNYEAFLSQLEDGNEPGITAALRRSTQKKDVLAEFMPTNLNCHVVRARHVSLSAGPLGSSKPAAERSRNDELVYAVITHGCPAAHRLGFKEGGLKRMLQSDLKKDPKLAERIEQRRDVVRSQVLAVAAAAFLTSIALATNNSPGYEETLELMCQTGFLLNMESLLSTIKNEKGMIEDVFDGIEWLNSAVSFEIVEMKGIPTKMRYAKCTQVVSSDSGESVVATFAVTKETFARLPLALQRDHALKVHAVLFTQGINEMQSVANSVFDTSLQDEINLASARRLQRWFQMYKGCISSMKTVSSDRQAELASLETELAILVENVKQSKRSSVQRKNVNILIESSDLCRRLGASRTTCCKSGKDRTSMSVTLECSRLLVDKFHVKQGVHLCNAMRERGVRRVNVLANTGKNKYAFNSLQLKYLPDCYRPPLLTADSSVAS